MQQSKLQHILSQIKQAAVKRQVQLVAVSKTKPVQEILDVYNDGQLVFGENYVDELLTKAPQLPEQIRWHFIGHLQSNKVSQIMKIKNLECVQTVDSMKLAEKLEKHCEKNGRELDIYVQVKLSEELSKSGVSEEESFILVKEIISNFKRIKLQGLMTIGPIGDLEIFKRLDTLRQKLDKEYNVQLKCSMGMSGDFLEAIEHGADVVRVGSAIFGPREPKQQN